jgi:hypothetical protein
MAASNFHPHIASSPAEVIYDIVESGGASVVGTTGDAAKERNG